MLPSEKMEYYKYYLEQLGNSVSKEDLKREGFIPAVKDLLGQGVDVNLKDNKGNTLLHYLVSNEAVKALSEEGRKEGDYTHVLDVPFMIASYQKKLNPFMTDENGFTPSCLAAYYGNMKDHAMLSSLESAVNHRRNMMGLYALSQMMCSSEYVTDTGHRMWMSNTQNENFVSACSILKTIKRMAEGRAKEME